MNVITSFQQSNSFKQHYALVPSRRQRFLQKDPLGQNAGVGLVHYGDFYGTFGAVVVRRNPDYQVKIHAVEPGCRYCEVVDLRTS